MKRFFVFIPLLALNACLDLSCPFKLRTSIKKSALLLLFSCITTLGFSQIRTISAAGSWNNTGIWVGANIADVITEDVTFNNNIGVVSYPSPLNYTVGNISMNSGNTLTIASGATLNLGDAGNAGTLSITNTGVINVSGSMTIWGDLNVGNDLILNVTGTLIIKGNVNMGNGASLTVDGNVSIGGNLNVGNNSTVGGSGVISVGGTCTDGNSTFCGTGPLPIHLLYFNAVTFNESIKIQWATTTEENFDKFIIQRSDNGKDFHDIYEVAGQGRDLYNTTSLYTFDDDAPLVGFNYYRLKALDLDATFEYFKIIAVKLDGAKKIVVYPNPASGGNINFRTNFTADDLTDRVVVLDALGNEIINLPASSYNNSIQSDAPLKSGVYVLKYTSKDFESVTRLVIKN